MKRTLILALLSSFVAPPARAAVDAYIWFEGAQGGSKDPGHRGWIEIDSWSLGDLRQFTVGSATGGAGGGKVSFNKFTVRKVVDSASPLLKQAFGGGTRFHRALLDCRKAGGGPYLRYVLTDVTISYQSGGHESSNPLPTEQFSLNFGKIEAEPASGISHVANPGVALKVAPAITKVTPSPTSATVGTPIGFSVEGIGSCKRGRIDWGDGTATAADIGPEYELVSGKGVSVPGHTYRKPGKYEVRAYGAADPMAKLPAPPPPAENACSGHATAIVTISETIHFTGGSVNPKK